MNRLTVDLELGAELQAHLQPLHVVNEQEMLYIGGHTEGQSQNIPTLEAVMQIT